MLRHESVERAKRDLSVRILRVCSRVAHRRFDVATRAIQVGRACCGGVVDTGADTLSDTNESETGAAVRTAWGVGPWRGAGFTSIQ